MKGSLALFLLALSFLLVACKTTTTSKLRTEKVEEARRKFSDLKATEEQVEERLTEAKNLLVSLPQDSPLTREAARQLAVLNKQATDLAPRVFAAELALEGAIKAEDARQTTVGATVPTLPETKPETKPETNTGPSLPKLPEVKPELTLPTLEPKSNFQIEDVVVNGAVVYRLIKRSAPSPSDQ